MFLEDISVRKVLGLKKYGINFIFCFISLFVIYLLLFLSAETVFTLDNQKQTVNLNFFVNTNNLINLYFSLWENIVYPSAYYYYHLFLLHRIRLGMVTMRPATV